MEIEKRQTDGSLLSALQEPSLYPGKPTQIVHHETYTSHLLFAGELAYKIKKPVRFPSMDLSRSVKRRVALENEFLMNQKLAPAIYLGVLALVKEDGHWRFGEPSQPGEYALLMRRLPARRMLSRLLECNQVDSQMIAALARIVERFHAQAKPDQAMRPLGHTRALEEIWKNSLQQIRPFVGPLLDRECFGVLQGFASAFIKGHNHILARRELEGRIREIHGDLRCDHICYAPEGIKVFGSRRPVHPLRWQDTAWDVASLTLDLDLRGEGRRAAEFLKLYLEFSGDRELPCLLPLYRSYCALVRGKDEWFFSAGTSAEASRYFDYACSAARQPPAEIFA
jgi:aminoglycoside phosphotransferase family enzyme